MILVVKRQEPNALLVYRKKKCASYSNVPSDVKLVVKRSLAEEQGFLCAYCMSRLPDAGLANAGNSDVTIEHWSPQKPTTGEPEHDSLDYRHMLAVCNGNRGDRQINQTCDAARGNTPITVSPLKKETLAGIYYKSNGEIHSTNDSIDQDLTITLNLNCEAVSLPQRRMAALGALKKGISRKYPGKQASHAMMQRLLDAYESETGKKTPYVGILTYWLRKRLQR